MRKSIGLKSGVDKERLKSLKDGDVLYTAVYDNGSGLTEAVPFVFREYVKAPGNNKGIWAKLTEVESIGPDGEMILATRDHTNQKGDIETVEDSKVNDISSGIFLDKKSALESWKEMAKKIYDSACRAVEEADD